MEPCHLFLFFPLFLPPSFKQRFVSKFPMSPWFRPIYIFDWFHLGEPGKYGCQQVAYIFPVKKKTKKKKTVFISFSFVFFWHVFIHVQGWRKDLDSGVSTAAHQCGQSDQAALFGQACVTLWLWSVWLLNPQQGHVHPVRRSRQSTPWNRQEAAPEETFQALWPREHVMVVG